MTLRPSRPAAFVLGILLLAALPVLARALRGDGAERCALDAVAIAPGRRVRFLGDSDGAREFCCVDCARLWVASAARQPREVYVTDETTGAELRAEDATFVRSRVVACEATGCCIHVFAREADARAHCDAFGGVLLTGAERPLGARR